MPSSSDIPKNVARRLRTLTTDGNLSAPSIVKEIHDDYPDVAPSRLHAAQTSLNGGKERTSLRTVMNRVRKAKQSKGRPRLLDADALKRITKTATRAANEGQPLTTRLAASLVSNTLPNANSSTLVATPPMPLMFFHCQGDERP